MASLTAPQLAVLSIILCTLLILFHGQFKLQLKPDPAKPAAHVISATAAQHHLSTASQTQADSSRLELALGDKGGDAYASCMRQGYTIVVSSYDRIGMLDITLQHWRSCPHVQQMHIVWHNPSVPLPQHLLSAAPNLQVRHYPDNKLTYRFKVPPSSSLAHFTTAAIFSVDDDQALDCRLMTAGFHVWCKQEAAGNSSLVGFEPRDFDLLSKAPSPAQGYYWKASCKGNCTFNTVWATKGAFLHAHQYLHYWDTAYAHLRAAVDSWVTGEDMLMSAILMHLQVPVIVVHPGPDLQLQHVTIPEDLKDKYASLGGRTSSHRGRIRQLLHQAFAGKPLRHAATSQWHILARNGSIRVMDKPCHQFPLRCTN